MISDFLGQIGGLEFISGDDAFTEAAEAQRQGNFGKPEGEEINIDTQPGLTSPDGPSLGTDK